MLLNNKESVASSPPRIPLRKKKEKKEEKKRNKKKRNKKKRKRRKIDGGKKISEPKQVYKNNKEQILSTGMVKKTYLADQLTKRFLLVFGPTIVKVGCWLYTLCSKHQYLLFHKLSIHIEKQNHCTISVRTRWHS